MIKDPEREMRALPMRTAVALLRRVIPNVAVAPPPCVILRSDILRFSLRVILSGVRYARSRTPQGCPQGQDLGFLQNTKFYPATDYPFSRVRAKKHITTTPARSIAFSSGEGVSGADG